MVENDNQEIYSQFGKLVTKKGEPTEGQMIVDRANAILEDKPLRGIRYNINDPDTKPGPIVRTIKPQPK